MWISTILLTISLFSAITAVYFFIRTRRMFKLKSDLSSLSAIFEKCPFPVFIKDVDNEFRYIYTNTAFMKIFGISEPDKMIGRTDFELFPTVENAQRIRENDEKCLHSDHLEEIHEETYLSGKRCGFQSTKLILRHNGRRLLFGFAKDVTEREQAEKHELNYREFLRELLDSLPFCITAKNPEDEYRYLFWNQQMAKVTGLQEADAIGKTDEEIFIGEPKTLEGYFRKLDLRALQEGEVKFELEQQIDNEIHIFDSIKKLMYLPEGGQIIWQVNHDISSVRQLEEKRVNLIKQQDQMIHYQRIINSCSRDIILKNNMEGSVHHMLEEIGKAMQADRCYIFQYVDNYANTVYLYEWCSAGTEAQSTQMPNIPMPADDHWTAELQAVRKIEIPDVELMPESWKEEQEVLRSQNIRSALIHGIWLDDKLWGFSGVDYVEHPHDFSECDRQMMQSAANLFILAWEQRRQMNQLADSVSLQRQIFESTAVPLVLFDLNHNIIAINPIACKSLKEPAERVIGRKCYQALCNNDAPPSWCPMRQSVEERKPMEIEFSGHGRYYWVTVQPILDRNGEPLYILESAVDITELHNKQEELKLSNDELISSHSKLQNAMEQATAASRAKSAFLATMSHEIRTPLNAIIGFSELLHNNSASPSEQMEYLDSIRLAGNALLQLINDILDLSKLEAGKMKMVAEQSDLNNLCRELIAIFSLRAKSKGLDLILECSPEMPLLLIDIQRLRQILLNLVGNAVKFTERGHIRISLNFTPNDTASGTLEIRVSDTGIGIQEKYLKTIFDPFIQQEHVNPSREGTGLGLSISKRLIENMGGSLDLESNYQVGSCFTVTLRDVRFTSKQVTDAQNSVVEISQPRALKHCVRILIVDDVFLNTKVLAAMLKVYNAEVKIASSGQEALKIIESWVPDLVLTDMWMPGMNGTELAAILRSKPECAHIRIVVITADMEVVDNGQFRLFDQVLLKPLSSAKLDEAIRSFECPDPQTEKTP